MNRKQLEKKYHQKPQYVYVARKSCGCAVGLVSDYADRDTGQAVAEFIRDGLRVNCEPWQKYVDEISNEPTFMACPHQEESSPEQATLPGIG